MCLASRLSARHLSFANSTFPAALELPEAGLWKALKAMPGPQHLATVVSRSFGVSFQTMGKAPSRSGLYTIDGNQHTAHEAPTAWSLVVVWTKILLGRITGRYSCSIWNGDDWWKHVRRPTLIIFRSIKSGSDNCAPLHAYPVKPPSTFQQMRK